MTPPEEKARHRPLHEAVWRSYYNVHRRQNPVVEPRLVDGWNFKAEDSGQQIHIYRVNAVPSGSNLTDGHLSPTDPPPYSQRGHSPRPSLRQPRPETSTTFSKALLPPPPTVNQLHLETGSNPILGAFHIDPRIPNRGFKAKGSKYYKKSPPHASFRTRQGEISLELGTTGDMTEEITKTNVLVASRSGDIGIKLLSRSPSQLRMGLDIVSKKGDIILFLPQNFTGVLQLSTRKGEIKFLPAVSRAMNVLKHKEREAIVVLGENSYGKEVDFCQLSSKKGNLVVGITGVDTGESKSGFWKKLFGRK